MTPVKNVRRFCSAVLAMLVTTSIARAHEDVADKAMDGIRPAAIRADMRFLADDLLEGRGTGTRGHELAAKFMATQFEAMGLQPAGDNGTYYQSVPLRSFTSDQTHSSLALIRSTNSEPVFSKNDYFVRGDPQRRVSEVEAPIVFVGFGVTAPEHDYDSYKDIDVKGKIVALIFGAPPFEPSVRAHYSSMTVKSRNAVAHGAIGLLVVDDPLGEQYYPFSERVRRLGVPEFRWLDPQGQSNDYFPQLKAVAYTNLEGTQKLLRDAPFSADQVFASAEEGKPASFALPVTAKIVAATQWQDMHSPNVIAALPGSDPALKTQYVVYSAHLDHLGIGEPVEGDSVYNGALDNASGSAVLLEAARAFSTMNRRPRRSILFLSVTGEESGLLGSDYFAHYPTVPKGSIVADVNTDGSMMPWPLQSITAFGAEHSSLGTAMSKAAGRLGLAISEDPFPNQILFVRSDQYSFVQQGIPAVWPLPGFKSDDPSINPISIFGTWQKTRYHEPQDDMEQPGLNFDDAAKYAKFCFLSIYLIAEDAQPPAWNKDDFFSELHGKSQ